MICKRIDCSVTYTKNVALLLSWLCILADMWYVNADGKEGWLPSDILRAMMGDEATMTSGESTPSEVKLNSNGASADASDMSDSDGKW